MTGSANLTKPENLTEIVGQASRLLCQSTLAFTFDFVELGKHSNRNDGYYVHGPMTATGGEFNHYHLFKIYKTKSLCVARVVAT